MVLTMGQSASHELEGNAPSSGHMEKVHPQPLFGP